MQHFPRYRDREDAARQLIPFLEKYAQAQSVLLAVPRGGVPIAYYIARHYHIPMELLMIKKIGHPSNPELAIGAVSMEDHIIDERQLHISKSYIDREVYRIRQKLVDRYHYFMGSHVPATITNKTIIIIDDGIATGNTILSSIRMLRRQQPAKIVVAVPVAPPDTARRIRQEVDEFICPYTPDEFYGVGYHYEDFSPVPDEEVIRLVKETNEYTKVA